jgi:diguanylate cyclase (GGDEF)-like protein
MASNDSAVPLENGDRRDADVARLEVMEVDRGRASARLLLQRAAEERAQAARDRQRASEERRRAAADRRRAGEERKVAEAALQRAHRDELTGAHRRGFGEKALQAEIDRARRHDGSLVLVFVDIDGLREVNNRDGHPAGDALLIEAVTAIRSQMRSYEPIVRFGGDEFVCAIADIDLEQAKRRFVAVSDSLARSVAGARITVGLTELRAGDTLGELIERADAALLATRRGRLLEVD